MTPTLTGTHIRLEQLTPAHLPALEKVAFDPSIWRYMKYKVTNPAELKAWAHLFFDKPNTFFWANVLQSTGEPIGATQFIDLDLEHRSVEIGNTWMAAPFRGTKVNPEAKLLQLTYAFETLNLQRVALKTHHLNLHSQAAIRKLGAQYEGTFRNHWIMPDGSTRHTVWFSITPDEWPTVKANLQSRLKTS